MSEPDDELRGKDGLTLGERVARRRRSLDKTQEQLAQALGRRQSYVSELEGRDSPPESKTLLLLPDALPCDGHWLLTGDGDPEPKETVGYKLDAIQRILKTSAQPSDLRRILDALRDLD